MPRTRAVTLKILTAPPSWGRQRCTLVVLAIIAAIGAVDYVTGYWVSLQLFYLLPIMLSVVWLPESDRWLIATLCVVVRLSGDIAAGIFEHVSPASVLWNRLAELALFCVVVWALDALVSLQRQLEERVRQRTAALEQAIASRDELQGQLLEISRRERGSIGHDLHDGLGQHLTATSMAATLLSNRLAGEGHPAADHARQVVGLLQDGIAQTRQIARGLLLSTVQPADLVAELEELASTVQDQHGIPCDLSADGSVRHLDTAVASHLFFIAQEATRNAARHARATQIAVQLSCDAATVCLQVSDNGSGLPAAPSGNTGLGLRIMRHRSELIGASFSVSPRTPSGTCVRCEVSRPPARSAAPALSSNGSSFPSSP
jgi:signal transduction histidine kinase